VKTESVKTGPSSLKNWILQFSLKLQIALKIDQAQTVRVRQDVAHWSPSLKDSRIHTSIEKCVISLLRKLWFFARKCQKQLLQGPELVGICSSLFIYSYV
jgi:hypothetical protein